MNNRRSSVSTHLSGCDRQFTPSQRGSSVHRFNPIFDHNCNLETRAFVLVVMAVLICSSAFAQVRFGTIVGTIADPTGATVSGANVKLTNLGTNETRTMQTANGGLYTFPNLIAG